MANKKNKGGAALGAIIAVFVVVMAVFIITFVVVSDKDSSSDMNLKEDKTLYVSSLDLNVDVGNDRILKMDQTITVTYVTDHHGFYQYIPMQAGERVRNLKVDTDYEVSHEGEMLLVKVGDPDRWVRGSQTYHLTYDYILPNSMSEKEFKFALVGQGWAMRMRDINVKITFPTATSKDDGVFSLVRGKYNADATNLPESSYSFENGFRTLNISCASLEAFEGIQLTAAVSGGFALYTDYAAIICAVIVGILILLSVVFKFVFARDKELTPIVEFYPPKLKNGKAMLPVQMGKLVDDTCSNEDITSLIFYWASKGYLTLSDEDGKTTLQKTRELTDPATDYEKTMFDNMFALGSGSLGEEKVTTDDLSNKFYKTVNTVKTSVNKEYSGKLYDKKVRGMSIAITAIAAVFAVVWVIASYLRISFNYINVFGFLLVVPLLVMAAAGVALVKYYFKIPKKQRLLLLIGYGLLCAGMAAVSVIFINSDAMSLAERIFLAIGIAVPGMFAPFISKRTDLYNEYLNSILGFRDFLRDAEKDKLESLLKDSPQYYYDILPYANVLGVSDIWEDKFKDVTLEPPTYYNGNFTVFDFIVFNSVMRSMSSNVSHSFTPPSNHGGGGSFSGGSFGGGGGGFGGGGGGGW